jgi:hypothetical protein
MYLEEYKKDIKDECFANCKDIHEEKRNGKFTGEVFDYIIYPDGTKELMRHDFNIIVDNCSVLIACLFKNSPTHSGILYWAVGSGSESWGDEGQPDPLVSDTQLLNETYRKAINVEDIIFLDGSNEETLTPTRKIQITGRFLYSEANGKLREFGLFGGDATGIKDSGLMINRKTHPLIVKTSGLQLERVLRITF